MPDRPPRYFTRYERLAGQVLHVLLVVRVLARFPWWLAAAIGFALLTVARLGGTFTWPAVSMPDTGAEPNCGLALMNNIAGSCSAMTAGVTEVHVLQARDDPQHIVELLFFDTADAANNYRTFLRKQVWSSSSPGLAGNPSAVILEELETAEDLAAAVLRSTAAAEQSARGVKEKKRIVAQQARAIERAPWRIEYQSGSTYELWNDSATPKFYVRITGEGVLHPKTAPRVDGHSSIIFHGLDPRMSVPQVDITWHRRKDQSDRPRHWTGNKRT